MKKAHSSSGLLLASLLAAALLSGCGGDSGGTLLSAGTPTGGGGGGSSPAPATAPDISASVADLLAYVSQLIAGTSDSGDPVDINPLTLATDDTIEPSPVN